MAIRIFYSWQSKRPRKYNMWFILDCLDAAIKQLRKSRGDIESDIRSTRDTKGVSGSPNIIRILESQIEESDIFVGDLTYVSEVDTETPNGKRSFWDHVFNRNRWQKEGQPSVNVTIEMGAAKGQFNYGYERVITVINTTYGEPSQLPFDIVQTRHPIVYNYNKQTPQKDIKKKKEELIKALKEAIQDILNTEHERQKAKFLPFWVWKSWQQSIDLTLPLERTNYVDDFFRQLGSLIGDERRIIRVCGLSGIGKSRLIYEYFNTLPQPNGEIQGRVLYVDENLTDAKVFLTTIGTLKLTNERKILIVDNCSLEVHNLICQIVSSAESRLSVITVSGDPDERPSQYYSSGRTYQIVLVNEQCKSLVDQLLRNTFPEFTEEERKLLVDFSSGLSFIAKLMADSEDRGKYEPGTLRQEEIVRRLLGPLYANPQSKAVMHACSLFSQLGFKGDLELQLNAVALNEDIFGIHLEGENPDDIPERRLTIFKETCRQLTDRQLLEIRGRAYAFRPSPLAVRLAEDWWRTCTASKFARIIPFLQETGLVERFCEQFRYLRHVQNARDIVAHLCDDFFSSAEVLDTEVGSRLFRTFVYVNPNACATALKKTFLSLSFEELRKLETGRRNLVWSLEKLCFLKETFNDAIEVLSAFAVSENEEYANNASGQFRQLFHIFLPGTKVNLAVRWNVIERLYNAGSEEYQSLSIGAMASALVADHFHRAGGAEDIGDTSPEMDHNPSRKEIFEYWKNVIQKLNEHIVNKGPFKDRAISIIKDRFYALCSFGGGPLVLPVMRTLIEGRFIDPMEARNRIQLAINSNRISDPDVLKELRAIYETLQPTSFEEKFRIYVSTPSTWEYRSNKEEDNPEASLAANIDRLSIDFIDRKKDWNTLAPLVFSGSIAEGLTFGKAVFHNADGDTFREFLDMAMDYFSNTEAEGRNMGIVLGALSEKEALPEAERIFEVAVRSRDLKHMAFAIARSVELPYQLISQLLAGAEKEEIPVEFFLEFNYGWGIRHLPVTEILEISNRLRKINSLGKYLALYNLSTWLSGKEDEVFAPFADFLRTGVMEDSHDFFRHIRNSMDAHYYTAVVIKLLTRRNDVELASSVMEMIIVESGEMERYYAKEDQFYRIMDVLQKSYFSTFWEGLTKIYLNVEKYGLAAFNLKNLIGSRHDFQQQSEGLLFGGNPEKFAIILEWCRKHKDKDIFWIAELLPIFGGPRNASSELHPFAKAFIDEFGDQRPVLSSIAAKIGTYGWAGSIIPKLESDKSIFTELINHPRPEVREWAKIHLEDVDRRIQFEKDREAEGFL